MKTEVRTILEAVQSGTMSVDDAYLQLKTSPFEDIGFAKVDLHRRVRQGMAEVIYGAGKTPEQIIGIIETMKKSGQDHILVTRLSQEAAELVSKSVELSYYPQARIGIAGEIPPADGLGDRKEHTSELQSRI